MPQPQNRRLEGVFILFLLCAASFLFLWNLGNHYLWQDEAQTALISKTVLTHGVPLGFDGKNSFSQELGAEYGENLLWRWHTWFPFYATAASFKLFGINTFAARLPFALFGMATVILAYFFAKSFWRSARAGAVTSSLLLSSIPFLLLSRQCRYYSMTAFFSLLGLYAYAGMLEGKKYSRIVFILSCTLLFHTHYIYCATLLAATALHALLCHRDAVRKMILPCVAVVLINLPWIIWLAGMKYGQSYGARMFDVSTFSVSSYKYFSQLAKHIFPPLLVLVPLGLGAATWIRTRNFFMKDKALWEKLLLPALFIALNVMALSLTSPAPFFRYLAPLIPAVFMIMGFIIHRAMNMRITLGLALIAAMILYGPWTDYLYELTHDYDGPIKGISKYLNEHGKPGDTVAVTYGDLPLKFYTSMRVVGGLTGEDLSPAKDARWVILRKYTICKKDRYVLEYLKRNVPWGKYGRIVLDYPEIPFENRESPDEHRFRTAQTGKKVVLFQRIRATGDKD